MYNGHDEGQYYQDMGNAAEAEAQAAMNAEAEYNQIQQPTTAISVLELFQPTKAGIEAFSNQVAKNVKDGFADPLRVIMLLKSMEKISENLKEQIKEELKTAAAKYGDKPFMFHGVELHYTSVNTKYDFSACGDVEWDELTMEIEGLENKRKKREEWLKTMAGPENVISKHGEATTIYPPIKKSAMGVKTSFK